MNPSESLDYFNNAFLQNNGCEPPNREYTEDPLPDPHDTPYAWHKEPKNFGICSPAAATYTPLRPGCEINFHPWTNNPIAYINEPLINQAGDTVIIRQDFTGLFAIYVNDVLFFEHLSNLACCYELNRMVTGSND